MKKIPSVFLRDFSPGGNPALVTREPNPECDWVFRGEGMATRKLDGTACMVRDGKLFRRYDAKGGKPAPPAFEPCQDPDPESGHWPGWIPVGPEDRWHLWAWYQGLNGVLSDGTYELCGPRLQGNPEGFEEHAFWRHGAMKLALTGTPITYESLGVFLAKYAIEGVVWHHDDGRMAKIKRTDLGLQWPIPQFQK